MVRIAVLFTASCLAAGVLVGCAFHQEPYITYPDASRPLNETAVFSYLDKDGASDSRITHVSGTPTACSQVGCRYWVRVVPGTNVATIKC